MVFSVHLADIICCADIIIARQWCATDRFEANLHVECRIGCHFLQDPGLVVEHLQHLSCQCNSECDKLYTVHKLDRTPNLVLARASIGDLWSIRLVQRVVVYHAIEEPPEEQGAVSDSSGG